MSIVKMKRLRAIGLASQRAELLAKLLSIGCVEVTEPTAELSNPQWTALLYRDVAPLSEVKAKAASVNNALEALRKYAGVKTGLFVQRKSIREEEFLSDEAMNKALETAAQINRYVQQIAQAHTQTNRLNAQRAGLMPWSSLDLPLDADGVYDVDTGYLTVHVEIRDGAARFIDSPCPDHVCEGYGWLTLEDQTATCLPARAVLTIVPAA